MGSALNKLVFRPPTPSYYITNSPNCIFLVNKFGFCIPSYFIDRKCSMTLLFSHGNAEDLGCINEHFVIHSLKWKCNIFIYEYSGYGQSDGIPSEENVYADIEAAADYLIYHKKIPKKNIIVYGRSLGSGPSVHLCTKYSLKNTPEKVEGGGLPKACEGDFGGLILQSSISSIHRVKLFTPFTLPGDLFCNIDKIHDVMCPILLIHGTQDEIVSFTHSQELLKRRLNVVNLNKSVKDRIVLKNYDFSYNNQLNEVSYSFFSLYENNVYSCWIEGGKHNDLEINYNNILTAAIKLFIFKCNENSIVFAKQQPDAKHFYTSLIPSHYSLAIPTPNSLHYDTPLLSSRNV